ncbi:MAG: alpha/beta hydrolase [Oscillospiraceae bacterium]|nr:alpha/beta hydrolase [Oscillospiraceae bacterium]
MFYNAKNLTLKIGDTEMDYVSFGKGSRNLVMIPGGGDGLTTVKGLAVPMAFSYRMFADDYKVYVFSRKNRLKEGYSTRDMADDQAEAMRRLGISNAMVLGVSQGGMISQYLAIDHPELVEKLVLAVTLSKQNDTVKQALGKWIELAEQGDHKQLMINTAENSYSEKYLKKYRLIYPILGLVSKPKNYERFLIQIRSCLGHDAYDELEKIKCPVLVIGGRQDKIVTGKASEEIAGKLGCEIHMYDDLGHAAYEEAKDFNERILTFFKE